MFFLKCSIVSVHQWCEPENVIMRIRILLFCSLPPYESRSKNFYTMRVQIHITAVPVPMFLIYNCLVRVHADTHHEEGEKEAVHQRAGSSCGDCWGASAPDPGSAGEHSHCFNSRCACTATRQPVHQSLQGKSTLLWCRYWSLQSVLHSRVEWFWKIKSYTS